MVHDKILQCNGYDFTMVRGLKRNGWIFIQEKFTNPKLLTILFINLSKICNLGYS